MKKILLLVVLACLLMAGNALISARAVLGTDAVHEGTASQVCWAVGQPGVAERTGQSRVSREATQAIEKGLGGFLPR